MEDLTHLRRWRAGEWIRSGRPDRQQGAGESGESGEINAANPDLQKLLEAMTERRLQQLDALPKDPAAAIRALTDYDFMTPEARQQFQELLDMLQQQMTAADVPGHAAGALPDDAGRHRRNAADDARAQRDARGARRGEDPDFQEFMHRWGHFFGPGLNSLDELMRAHAAADGRHAPADAKHDG